MPMLIGASEALGEGAVQNETRSPQDRAPDAPGERTCPSCGAANPDSASFCWQCFTNFGPPAGARPGGWGRGRAPTPPASGPGISPPPSFGIPAPQPFPSAPVAQETRSVWPRMVVGFVAAAVIAGAAVFLVGKLRGGVGFPESIIGIPRVHSPVIDAAIEQGKKRQGVDGMEMDMAVYGTDTLPRLFVLWVRAPGGTDPEEAFRLFAQGASSTGNTAVQTTRMTTENVDGTDYICAPVTGQLAADMCFWHDGDIYWVLLDLRSTGLADTRELSHQAQLAVG